MTRDRCVAAWGHFFSRLHGWMREPDLSCLNHEPVAAIVKLVQPGVVVIEVSA